MASSDFAVGQTCGLHGGCCHFGLELSTLGGDDVMRHMPSVRSCRGVSVKTPVPGCVHIQPGSRERHMGWLVADGTLAGPQTTRQRQQARWCPVFAGVYRPSAAMRRLGIAVPNNRLCLPGREVGRMNRTLRSCDSMTYSSWLLTDLVASVVLVVYFKNLERSSPVPSETWC